MRIDLNAALARVQAEKRRTGGIRLSPVLRRSAAQRVAVAELDLDHVSAEPGQQLPGVGTGNLAGEFHDANPVERTKRLLRRVASVRRLANIGMRRSGLFYSVELGQDRF